MERAPNHLLNLGRSKGGRMILGVFLLMVVLLAVLIWTTRDKEPEFMDRGVGDGQYYERDQTLLEQERDTLGVE